MEQAAGRYWMWTKRKHSLGSHFQSPQPNSYEDSWEEQAFAEDAAGALGGCVWPPRSYSCSFCRREFRSAQALGGHMNVHRRDRARLKQPSSPQNEIHHHDHQFQKNNHQLQSPFASNLGNFQYPSQLCTTTLVYNNNNNPNPNYDHPGNNVIIASPSSPSRVSAPSSTSQENNKFPENTSLTTPPFPSPIVEDHHHHPNSKFPISSSKSWSKLVAGDYHISHDLKNNEEKKNSKIVESAGSCRVKSDYVKRTTDLSVSLNFVVRRTCPTNFSDDKDEKTTIGCKRRRTEVASLPLFLNPTSVDRHNHLLLQSEEHEHELSTSSIEELDLELRLGDRPNKVK
ncbi:hypothetical protein LWI28_023759 [Acer negundo]|uniref:C2H2-type domain-containing protein n=1 Tax=Acer negundo TaxID=4023 RepID=A0AAD5I7Z9_ACENE|nr:hypothetical protein LWI28_023759 [Acer negundo]KAK4833774.1 hypothetical protein QYF36_011032 [Acer negundo]